MTLLLFLALSAQGQQQGLPQFGGTKQPGVLSWKIFYGDGAIVRAPRNRSAWFMAWQRAPVDDVQIVIVYFDLFYPIWKHVGGRNRLYILPYRYLFHGALGNGDYYWWDGGNRWGAWGGSASAGPCNLPVGVVKTGTLLSLRKWRQVYERANGPEGETVR
jgi:hypothetical protein